MLRLGRGVRVQYETVARSHILLFPEGPVDLNETAHAVLSRLPARRDGLHRALCDAFGAPHPLEGFDAFVDEAVRARWIERT